MAEIFSPVHLNLDLGSLHLIQSLQFFSKNDKKIQVLDQWLSDPTLRKFSLDPPLRKFALDPTLRKF